MDDWYAFDDDYVRRLREDDPWTTRHFFHYFDRLLTFKMLPKLRRPDLVEDGKQIVYVRVLAAVKAGEIRNGNAFGAYVSRTADNVIKELLRQEALRKKRTDPLGDDHVNIPSPRSSDKSLIEHETRERVHKVLAELSDRDRELLERSLLHEDTPAELCEQFKVKPEYLRVLLFRARERFRSLFETDPPKKLPPE